MRKLEFNQLGRKASGPLPGAVAADGSPRPPGDAERTAAVHPVSAAPRAASEQDAVVTAGSPKP